MRNTDRKNPDSALKAVLAIAILLACSVSSVVLVTDGVDSASSDDMMPITDEPLGPRMGSTVEEIPLADGILVKTITLTGRGATIVYQWTSDNGVYTINGTSIMKFNQSAVSRFDAFIDLSKNDDIATHFTFVLEVIECMEVMEGAFDLDYTILLGTEYIDVEFPSESVELPIANNADFTFVGTRMEVSFGSDVMASLAAKGGNITVSADPVDMNDLTCEQAEVVGVKPVYRLEATVDGVLIRDLGGTVTVSVLYLLRAPFDPAVYALDDAGNLEHRNTIFDSDNARVIFDTTISSYYMVGEVGYLNPTVCE